ncbi:MAG: hypothetical protein HN742_31300 [Lentisphaerae bacterium]|jgi:hypothetical protein|nr:hypothetical protein [Lentisphaerota bacterium]MBT4815682.1 hypothetical protein [Lentisphaerota bacterium]MBT5612009.1 hypothetical protein [Lentisphaerota bacterium]MBT7057893.1 hypothetical protein [Lentisphaerota bacterium]MBT7846398.1 hypothetical protein [Lentisphaerota bacterium]
MRSLRIAPVALLCFGALSVSGCRSVTGLSPVAADRSTPPVPATPSGILFVDNTHNHPETGEGIPFAKQKGLDLFAYDGMAGIIEYVQWCNLEPEEGAYHFSGVLALLRQAQEKGKKLALGVICGRHVPAWYIQRHSDQVFRYRVVQRREDIGSIEKDAHVVLPWVKANPGVDESLVLNGTYFSAFSTLMRALSAEVEAQGLTESLMYVAITGPGGGNALEVQWSMPLYDDWQRFDFDATKQELWIAGWVRCANEFRECFPRTALALAVTDQYGCRLGSTKDKVMHARNTALSGRVLDAVMDGETPETQRVYPMGLWLSHWNRWGEDAHPLCRLLQDKREAGFRFGLQGHLIRHRDLAALEKDTIDKGVEAGATWIEIWHKDIFKDGFERIPPKCERHFRERE